MAARFSDDGFQLPLPPADSSHPAAAAARGGGRPERWLLFISTVEYLGLSVSLQASSEVWLQYYASVHATSLCL